MPKEEKLKFVDCRDFTPGLNTLDDPIDIPSGASPYMINMDVTRKGKMLTRYGFELVAVAPNTNPMRGLQTYYRTYDDNSAIDNSADINGAYANTYAIPTSISEAATDKLTFTPSAAAKGRVFSIAVWIVAKSTRNLTLTLHDASNNVLGAQTILNATLVNGKMNFFQVPYNWTSGALHFHVTADGASATLKCNVANDLSTASYEESYRTSGDYLLAHSGDGNSYYITAANTTPVLMGAWGVDTGNVVRGTTFLNYAILGEGTDINPNRKWDQTTFSNLDNSPRSNIFGVYKKALWGNDTSAPSKWAYSDTDALTGMNTNFININVGDGWKSTAIIPNVDFLQAFKEDSIYGINFSFDTSYNITVPQMQQIVTSQGGCFAPGSAQAIYGYTYYMSVKGFESYGPSQERVTANKPEPLSLTIEPTFKAINLSYKDNIHSTFFDQKYICAAPINGAQNNNTCFVYNESVKRRFGQDCWTIYTGIPALMFAKFRNSNKVDELYFVSPTEPNIYKFNNTFSDNGAGYNRIWTSKTFQFGERTQWRYLDIEGLITLGTTLYVDIYVDGVVKTSFPIDKDNLVVSSTSGGYIGEDYVGGDYVGGGFSGSATPLYKFKKRIYCPDTVNYGYNMYFVLRNNAVSEGWGLNRYVLCYAQDPEEPTYAKVTD